MVVFRDVKDAFDSVNLTAHSSVLQQKGTQTKFVNLLIGSKHFRAFHLRRQLSGFRQFYISSPFLFWFVKNGMIEDDSGCLPDAGAET